jgi:uncharacterized membrane protein (UPF0136 family)
MISGVDSGAHVALTDTRSAVTHPRRVGLAIALGGAALAVVALWLPYWDAESLRRAWPREPGLHDPENLLWRGLLWPFVSVAIACAVSVVIAEVSRRRTWRAGEVIAGAGVVMAGIVAIFFTWVAGMMAVNSTVFAATQLESPDPGLGVYAEGVAGALMLIGGLRILRPRDPVAMRLILVVTAVLIVRFLFHEAAFDGPYIGQSVSNAPGG